ncbi:MAG: hypothetical protein JNJ71_02205 [Rubrivivax sp.]|nr:hypothetical protein [Rubrivivax sp.]
MGFWKTRHRGSCSHPAHGRAAAAAPAGAIASLQRGCAGPLRTASLWLLAIALLWLAAGPAWAIKQRVIREPEVRYVREVWLDAARQRHVNVRIGLPTREAARLRSGPMPVMLFSAPQGFRWGGYADHYEDLSQEMLRRGVVMVMMSHYDIEEPMSANERFADVYPGILTGARNDPAVDRYEDALFVLAQLQARHAARADDWPALDLSRLAVSGHSSGTLTALHLAGMPVRERSGRIFAAHRDPRIKAFVLYSFPLEYRGPRREDLQQVGPVAGLHVAGSTDHPRYRHTAYRWIHRAPQHWLVAEGGHNIGSTGSEALVLETTGRFIDVHLNGSQALEQQLSFDALSAFAPGLRQFTRKPALRFKPWDQRDFTAWARETLPGGRWLHSWAMANPRKTEAPAP